MRAFGLGLWAEKRGDVDAAIRLYRLAQAAPQKGDIRMLIAHHLARALHAHGDAAGAAAACDDVIRPRDYQSYRALLLPDCLLWTGRAQELVDAWRGSTFALPAVVEARARVAR